jgi:hypothetical protein
VILLRELLEFRDVCVWCVFGVCVCGVCVWCVFVWCACVWCVVCCVCEVCLWCVCLLLLLGPTVFFVCVCAITRTVLVCICTLLVYSNKTINRLTSTCHCKLKTVSHPGYLSGKYLILPPLTAQFLVLRSVNPYCVLSRYTKNGKTTQTYLLRQCCV